MMPTVTCWQCARGVEVPLPMGRREACPHCDADLRCCRMCDFYDRSYARDCREPMADAVTEKERANLCDYFRPGNPAGVPGGDEAASAREKLARMFGDEPLANPSTGEAKASSIKDEAEAARRKLEDLFKK